VLRILCIGLLISTSVFAQQNDTLMGKKPHSPKKATIMSAILPGSGQVYNHKWWKVPIIYGGFAALGYAINFNNREYNLYRDAYLLRIDNDPSTVDQFNGIYTDANLLYLQDYYHRNRDLSIIGAVILYTLNIVDADVDAHLFNFDVSPNLSLNIQPKPLSLGFATQPVPGLSFSLRLK